jgi:predicted metal-dependent hydrolase
VSINPVILAFIEDLMTAVRLESMIQTLDFEFVHWQDPWDLPEASEPSAEFQWAEPLEGRDGKLIERITELRPALIVFDLNNQHIPSLDWISLITSVPATRGIPVVCYGPHVDQEALRAAEQAGAEVAFARSRFMQNTAEIISDHAQVVDVAALQATCHEDLSHYALRGLEQFNRGEYFEAHDSLELAWMEDPSLGRDLYRAVLQVAVAYYQITRGNYNGAAKMFLRMRKWLSPLPGTCRGINIEQLRQDVQTAHTTLLELGALGIERFDLDLLHPVEYKVIY